MDTFFKVVIKGKGFFKTYYFQGKLQIGWVFFQDNWDFLQNKGTIGAFSNYFF